MKWIEKKNIFSQQKKSIYRYDVNLLYLLYINCHLTQLLIKSFKQLKTFKQKTRIEIIASERLCPLEQMASYDVPYILHRRGIPWSMADKIYHHRS